MCKTLFIPFVRICFNILLLLWVGLKVKTTSMDHKIFSVNLGLSMVKYWLTVLILWYLQYILHEKWGWPRTKPSNEPIAQRHHSKEIAEESFRVTIRSPRTSLVGTGTIWLISNRIIVQFEKLYKFSEALLNFWLQYEQFYANIE